MKKGGRESLTGGTGDVNPQWYTTRQTQTGTDVTSTFAFPLPPGMGLTMGQGGKATAMEILKVQFFFPTGTTTTTGSPNINMALSNKNWGTTAPSQGTADATIVAVASKTWQFVGTTAAFQVQYDPFVVDLTDNAGHGILYGSQYIYLTIWSNGTGSANTVSVRVLYREKKISQTEMIGMVLQGTQN